MRDLLDLAIGDGAESMLLDGFPIALYGALGNRYLVEQSAFMVAADHTLAL
jgi:hypothetical protein